METVQETESLLIVAQRKRYKNQLRGSLNKFLDFFRMGTFIDDTHMKL